jgi:hypothetical protein
MKRAVRSIRAFVVLGLVVAVTGSITAPGNPLHRPGHRSPSPSHVYAPYFRTWAPGNLLSTAVLSGVRYFTLAFIQTAYPGSCTPTWNGNPRQPVTGGLFRSEISGLRKLGGSVILSFGGSSADNSGTEMADSCGSVARIATAYESIIRTYGISRLDMDVEGRALTDLTGIDRRNEALHLTETWAARHGYPLQIQYTLPTLPSGLPDKCLSVLADAVYRGTRVDMVNIMAFDYYQPHEGVVEMGAAADTALRALHVQLARLYRGDSAARVWAMEGVTLLPGIDSYPARTEITRLSDAAQVIKFAESKRIGLLSIWSVQRDNGNCPGIADSGQCSGLRQRHWAFSRLLDRFTRPSS